MLSDSFKANALLLFKDQQVQKKYELFRSRGSFPHLPFFLFSCIGNIMWFVVKESLTCYQVYGVLHLINGYTTLIATFVIHVYNVMHLSCCEESIPDVKQIREVIGIIHILLVPILNCNFMLIRLLHGSCDDQSEQFKCTAAFWEMYCAPAATAWFIGLVYLLALHVVFNDREKGFSLAGLGGMIGYVSIIYIYYTIERSNVDRFILTVRDKDITPDSSEGNSESKSFTSYDKDQIAPDIFTLANHDSPDNFIAASYVHDLYRQQSAQQGEEEMSRVKREVAIAFNGSDVSDYSQEQKAQLDLEDYRPFRIPTTLNFPSDDSHRSVSDLSK